MSRVTGSWLLNRATLSLIVDPVEVDREGGVFPFVTSVETSDVEDEAECVTYIITDPTTI